VGAPGHSEGHRHDIYVEVSGPAAADVHHNFVQRWNEASERSSDDGRWGHDEDDQLPFPVHLAAPRGWTPVQIQRNVHAAGIATDIRAPEPHSTTSRAANSRSSINICSPSTRHARRCILRTKRSRCHGLRRLLPKRRLDAATLGVPCAE
jgi:phosphatidylserine/phosphatidylglycerophosphate/cardiolipin synthase-like enzyme